MRKAVNITGWLVLAGGFTMMILGSTLSRNYSEDGWWNLSFGGVPAMMVGISLVLATGKKKGGVR